VARVMLDSFGLAKACERTRPERGPEGLARVLAGACGQGALRHVLTRSGWHRLGGVVDRAYGRVADNILHWAEHDGDVDRLMEKCAAAGYFATRLQGCTHYFVAPWEDGSDDFLQIEVEELQEVLDHPLVDPDWYPESIAEFVDPLELPRLAPEPIGDARYVFRRVVRINEFLQGLDPARHSTVRLRRFFADWGRSSAGQACTSCGLHWALALREMPLADGGASFSAKPVATFDPATIELRRPDGLAGAVLANWLHRVDLAAGYPFAWYFLMLASRLVPVSVGEQVQRDLHSGFDYLPERDVRVVTDWAADPYTC